MSKFLLTIALGPVQDFIAAARRTRDLWFGSFLLSEISKATALAVKSQGGELIFPNPVKPSDLDPVSPKESLQGGNFNVANIILAELPAGWSQADIQRIVNAAEKAAIERWKIWAGEAGHTAGAILEQTLWGEQIDDVLEFYAAWMPLDPVLGYAKTREKLMLLQAGRKALRNFKPHAGHAIPKSSLDGARESVLCKDRQKILEKNRDLAQRLRLLPGEELDILGVTKRCATKAAFASVVRVAADAWIRGIECSGGDALAALQDIAQECEKVSFYKDDKTAYTTGSGPTYKNSAFPYDGSVLFPSRLTSLLRPPKDGEIDLLSDTERGALKKIQRELLPLLQKELGYGEPEPYLAILAADGDRMGKTLSHLKKMQEHQAFSKQLAQFAVATRSVVQDHQGCLVYAGGDDVLAFVPVDQCVKCARQLHDSFADLLKCFEDEQGNPPTLSVGIAIVHCTEPLEDLLNYGRDAEKNAKHPDRDGLAVGLHSRGGAPVHIRAAWKEGLDQRLLKWAAMHREDTLSDQAVYGLRQLALDYANWPKNQQTDEVIEKDIARLFKRKKADGKSLDTDFFQGELDACFHAAEHDPVEVHQGHHAGILRLANEWIIARKIAAVMKQAQDKKAVSL